MKFLVLGVSLVALILAIAVFAAKLMGIVMLVAGAASVIYLFFRVVKK